MIQLRSVIKPADNSGAKKLAVIGISTKIGKTATVGDVVNCVVKGADPRGVVQNKEKVKVLVVRTKKEIKGGRWKHGRLDDNAGVVIDKNGLPKGTRILGPIAREIKEIGYTKIASLSREVV